MEASTQKHCRLCGRSFFAGPLLRYENMPNAAQFLPDAASLHSDKGGDLEVFQCSGCGLVQLGRQPVPYYREVIRASAFSREMLEFRIRQFKDFVHSYSLKGKKVIEIGCGRGEYLTLMLQCGVNAYGLEYSQESVKFCTGKGLQVTQGFIEHDTYKLNYAPFEAFFILNFLEHLPDLNAALRGIWNNLNDDAVGMVEVPNFDMIVRKRLFSEFIGDHLFYFTRETLVNTLHINGFEIIESSEVWHDYIISAIVRKRPKIDLSPFHLLQMQLKDELEKYICRFGEKKVAIWGAGHQALAVMALTNMGSSIKYVVDSASFKQGKFTPATHLPIVSPDMLDVDPVDAVIVMAASYSDEVVDIIRQKYSIELNIAILRDTGLEEVRPGMSR